ncbi:MAG: hopanoid biosynthesis associated radical SAM protein HpnJ [Desulfoferrobacter sp.]
MKKTLFLNPPSFEGFDGGAGARYPARREVTSYWYPTWLAQPAAIVPGSKLVDAPPQRMNMQDVLKIAAEYELIIMHTSFPSLVNDIKCAEALKSQKPDIKIGFIGAHATVLPEDTLRQAAEVDFVCRNEFDYTCLELAEGRPYREIKGITYRSGDGTIQHAPERELSQDLDHLPSVLPVYHRDLDVRNYFIGYLLHPYVSFYTGRGCPGRCTFCLWPQTIAGHRYRTKSPAVVIREMEEGKELFPQAREWFFDDDTFTADRARAIEISKGLKKLKLTWSCNARANLDFDTLKQLRNNGLRLLVVGFETGNEDILKRIKKGVTLDMSREFVKNCTELGIKVHGTFIIGLPIESRRSIEETIRFAQELDPYSIQVSIAAPFPGTELYDEAVQNGWLNNGAPLTDSGIQMSTLNYPDLTIEEIEDSVERMYRQFYFHPKPILRMLREMATNRHLLVRRLREGKEFLDYLNVRKQSGHSRKHQEHLQ